VVEVVPTVAAVVTVGDVAATLTRQTPHVVSFWSETLLSYHRAPVHSPIAVRRSQWG